MSAYIWNHFFDGEQRTERPALAFGYDIAIPDGSPAAWGARAIWPSRHAPKERPLDLLGDRQGWCVMEGCEAYKDGLLHALNSGKVLEAIQLRMCAYQREGIVSPRESREVVLFENNWLKAVGNSNGSHGYFYLTAFIKPVPDMSKAHFGRALPDLEDGEFIWSNEALPPVGSQIRLTGAYPNSEGVGERVKVLGYGVCAKHLFLVTTSPPSSPVPHPALAQDSEWREILEGTRQWTSRSRWPDYETKGVEAYLHFPSVEGVALVMGREWEPAPELLEEAETRHGRCTLERDGDWYVMLSPTTGRHRLHVTNTDAERLAIHWQGFVETNEGRSCKAGRDCPHPPTHGGR